MKDPFSALLKSLNTFFHLEVKRNGKYFYQGVQQLKEAIENYNPEIKNSFIYLQKAVEEAIPYIQKRQVNVAAIKEAMDELAQINKTQPIHWDTIRAHFKRKSQSSANYSSNKENDLITWLTHKTGKAIFQMDPSEITQALLENKNRHGFSQKLNALLKKNPDFLFQLIMDSERNFIKICHSRLILYLTDKQIAKAIIHHIPIFIHKKAQPDEQIELLVQTLNDILSNGRSVSTLLRSAEAKPILFSSLFFKRFQKEEPVQYQNKVLRSSENLISELMKPN